MAAAILGCKRVKFPHAILGAPPFAWCITTDLSIIEIPLGAAVIGKSVSVYNSRPCVSLNDIWPPLPERSPTSHANGFAPLHKL